MKKKLLKLTPLCVCLAVCVTACQNNTTESSYPQTENSSSTEIISTSSSEEITDSSSSEEITDSSSSEEITDSSSSEEITNSSSSEEITDSSSSEEITNSSSSDIIENAPTEGLTYQLSLDGTFATVTNYEGTDSEIIIASTYQDAPVIAIGEGAFANCSSFTNITIPDSVTSIGFQSFYNCDGLTSVTIPDSVTYIGKQAFYNCGNLTIVTIGNGVTTIEAETFHSCYNLTELTFPFVGITHLGYLFGASKSLYNATFVPDTLTTLTITNGQITENAFYYCRSLINVTLEKNVSSIGTGAFWGCENLTNLQFEDSIQAWNAIIKGDNWNNGVPATKVICKDSEVEL